MKFTIKHRILCFLFFATCLFIGDAFSAGSNFSEGVSHALFFGFFGIPTAFVVLLVMGFVSRGVIETVLRHDLPYRSMIPWAFPAFVACLFLTAAIPKSESDLFRRCVSDDVPESLEGLKYWSTSGFGGSQSLLSYRVSPLDFDKVLTRHIYIERHSPSGFKCSLFESYYQSRSGFAVEAPPAPLVYEYNYVKPTRTGARTVTHYTTVNKDFVLTCKVDG